MDRTKDLCSRGDKTALVNSPNAVVGADEVRNNTKAEPMDACVEEYCNLYTEDLVERLGLDKPVLDPSLTNPA